MAKQKTTQEFFNKQSHSWDKDINTQHLSRIEMIFTEKLSFLKAPFLDLGSGTGVLIPVLNKYNPLNSKIIELDIAIKMLIQARDKYKNRNTCFILGDAHSLPLPENYFNSVICFQAFPHFYDKYKASLEIRSSLKPGGLLVILHLMGHKELNKLHRQAGREVENDRILPAEQLAEVIASAGFSIKHMEEKSDIYLIIAQNGENISPCSE